MQPCRRGCVAAHVENGGDGPQLGGQRHRRLVALIETLRERLGHNRIQLASAATGSPTRAPAPAAWTICSASAVDVAPVNGSLPVSISNRTMPSEKMSVRWSTALAERLLGRHVRDRAPASCPAAVATIVGRLFALGAAGGPGGQTEVENLRVALGRDDDVGRLDVAVDDALGVRVGERVGNLHGEIDRAARIQRPPGDRRCQRLARHELEHEKQLALILADLVQRGDVRVRERGGGARLLQEPLAAFAGSPATSAASTLIATVRPSRVSRARYTSPMPPAPIRSRIL